MENCLQLGWYSVQCPHILIHSVSPLYISRSDYLSPSILSLIISPHTSFSSLILPISSLSALPYLFSFILSLSSLSPSSLALSFLSHSPYWLSFLSPMSLLIHYLSFLSPSFPSLSSLTLYLSQWSLNGTLTAIRNFVLLVQENRPFTCKKLQPIVLPHWVSNHNTNSPKQYL